MLMVIAGVFAKGDTRQTLWGLFGGLLFWTGWVEIPVYVFANRFGTQPELDPVTGEIVTRPEYLILPASFGFWMMVMIMYLFSTRNGCNFINWWQRLLFKGKKNEIAAPPDDTSHEHRYLHGADDDSVGFLLTADVLL